MGALRCPRVLLGAFRGRAQDFAAIPFSPTTVLSTYYASVAMNAPRCSRSQRPVGKAIGVLVLEGSGQQRILIVDRPVSQALRLR